MSLARPLVVVLALLALTGCGPLVIEAAAEGTQKLPLPGAPNVTGVVTKALSYRGVVVPRGSEVRVEETWVMRHDKGAQPPGYRISGHYDPATQTDGLMLPRQSVDVFYFSAVLPESKQRVPVPSAHFEKR